MSSRDDLPRVSIDSFAEWTRTKENYKNAAIAILDNKLAELNMTAHRDLLLQHTNQFVAKTLEICEPNLRINGRNFEEYEGEEEDKEQFDEALDRRVWSLSDQRRTWNVEIAKKRRTTPQEVEKLMKNLIACQRDIDTASVRMPEQDIDSDMEEDFVPDSTSKDVLILAHELSVELPEQLERSERVKDIDQTIRSLQP